jgi:hypothetical protein
LSAEFGKGFDRTNLQNMWAFYLAYPIRDAVRRELSWTHYRLLLRAGKPEARAFYEAEAVVRYTLPEGNTQIFASRYQLYLPTEEELSRELQRERQRIELERQLAEEAPDQ